jgi:hypothetical protein
LGCKGRSPSMIKGGDIDSMHTSARIDAMAVGVESGCEHSEDDVSETPANFKKNSMKKDRERNPRLHRRALNYVRCKSSTYSERTSKCDQYRRPNYQPACPPHGQSKPYLVQLFVGKSKK